MEDANTIYQELVKEAEKLGKSYWVLTGNTPPQENAMFAVLWKEIQDLKRQLSNKP